MTPRILIVEDNAPMRTALRDLLRQAYPEALLFEAGDGATAIELCARCVPQLILLDLKLPDANGIDLIPRLRARAPEGSVLVLSQHASSAHVRRALAAGARAFVAKDAMRCELLPEIAKALDAP